MLRTLFRSIGSRLRALCYAAALERIGTFGNTEHVLCAADKKMRTRSTLIRFTLCVSCIGDVEISLAAAVCGATRRIFEVLKHDVLFFS